MQDPRQIQLIHGCLDGALSVEEAHELNALILSSAEARASYWEMARTHALLREWGAETWGLEPKVKASPAPKPQVTHHFGRWLLPVLAAAAAIMLGFFMWPAAAPKTSTSMAIADQETDDDDSELTRSISPAPDLRDPNIAVAVLTRTTNVQWASGEQFRAPGKILGPGLLRLERGLAQIEFVSGARVILEGPAEFELISDMEAHCAFGKFSAEVPEQAHGFKVTAPGMTVVDLGTSFGCNVPRDGKADVHVLEGRIEIEAEGTLKRELKRGEAARAVRGGLEEVLFNPKEFVSPGEMLEQANAEGQRRYSDWSKSVAAIADDSSAVLHYTFDDQPRWSATVSNRVTNASSATNGVMTGAAWGEGRWPGKGALEFKGSGDRVRLHLDGEHRALTYLAWVRVDSLPHKENALVASVQSGIGAALWSITSKGEISFKVRADKSTGRHYFGGISAPVITAMQRGRWLHLATVYDVETSTVIHYLDGQLISKSIPKYVAPVILADVELGNSSLSPAAKKWWPKSHPVPERDFTGRMDEVVILARAMTAEEVRAHFEAGRL